MTKTLTALVIALLFTSFGSFAQTYSLNNGFANGGTVTSCTGIFKDSNRDNNYANNENYTVTFAPATTSQAIQLQFDVMSLGIGDTLWVYDGNNINAPLIQYFAANNGPTTIRASSSNPSRALTIRFLSDASGVNQGWSATLSCKSPCQKVDASILSTSPQADAQGFINICKGQTVLFRGKGSYPDNDLLYHQSDTTSRFSWRITDGRDTSGIFLDSLRHRFNNEGGFLVELMVTDKEGCTNTNKAQVKVRTGIRPVFNIQTQARNCSSDTLRVSSTPQMVIGSFSNPPVVADSIFLPDGTNTAYQTTLNITQFAPGQTLNNINDLQGILVNMEHSWLGDIEIAIKAPNGVSVRLKYGTGVGSGWESYLGEPVDEPSTTSPLARIAGKGYDYLFSPTPTYGTMTNERGRRSYSYRDNAGQNVTNHTYLPAGSYASEESLNALLGTPLNGLWTITVIDRYAVDNGFIFYWTIKFKPSLYPTAETYNTTFGSGSWGPLQNVIAGSNTSATLISNTAGSFPFTYTVTDNFGCNHDTTFNLVVLQSPQKPNLGRDTALCNGQNLNLQVANVQTGNTYLWSTGATTTSITASQPTTYWVETKSTNGCTNRDTVVVQATTPYTVSLGRDTSYCASSPNVLTPSSSVPVASYTWNDNTTGNTLTTTGPGMYWVEAKDAAGCKVNDTIVISDNPINTFDLPADTIICEESSYMLTLNPPSGTNITWSDGSTGYSKRVQAGTIGITANYIGCVSSSQMVINNKPLPRINLGADTSICYGFTIPLAVSYPGARYVWNTGSTDSTIVVGTDGNYWAQASLNGCTYRDTMQLTTLNCACNVNIPNAFSPNGDGINDYFVPKIDCFPKTYRLSVFNRYGQQIFESQDFRQWWDGKQNGNYLPVGTYYYILTYRNESLKTEEKFNGSIMLLR